MNTHYYNLHPGPFNLIKKRQKTIEMRLNDERRKLLRVGDRIIFTNIESGEIIKVEVLKLESYRDFDELYANYNPRMLGYHKDETINPRDMEKYYNRSLIKKYGALAITIAVSDI